MQKVEVLRNTILVGYLSKEDDGSYKFEYVSEYLADEKPMSISVNFPINIEMYRSEFLFPFFYNMLAEGNIKKAQCRSLKIDENDSFSRLIKTSKDDTIGAVHIGKVVIDE